MLELKHNRIGPAGAQTLVASLSSNVWMMELAVGDYGLDDDHSQLESILNRNKTLKKVSTSQLASLFEALDPPTTLLYEGRDVFRDIAGSVRRVLISLRI